MHMSSQLSDKRTAATTEPGLEPSLRRVCGEPGFNAHAHRCRVCSVATAGTDRCRVFSAATAGTDRCRVGSVATASTDRCRVFSVATAGTEEGEP